MDKERFLSLVQNYTSLTSDEAVELVSLQNDFPYSQVVHNLAARAAQDNGLNERERLLHVSAIYTTDRSVLKSIMTAARIERSMVRSEKPAKILTPAKKVPTEISDVAELENEFVPSDLSGDALVKDIMAELKKLKASKHNFEVNVEKYEKSLRDEDVKASKKIKDSADLLIEEIKTTKKKVSPAGKQKEQIEIIENFIKSKPSITKTKAAAPVHASDDLAEKSLLYGDNIISETLVEILLKQGKKDKAIEVLKKLIWKFPQKKTYFAARIEELKK